MQAAEILGIDVENFRPVVGDTETSGYADVTGGSRTTYATCPLWAAYTGIPFSWLKSKITGKRPSLTSGGLHALAVQSKFVSNKLAQKELGHSARSLEQTINDTIDWMQKHVD